MKQLIQRFLPIILGIVILALIGFDIQFSQSNLSTYEPFRLPLFALVFILTLGFSFPYASATSTSQLIRKITLSGMLIAIAIILERVISIPIGLTNRIAFGSAVVIASSLIVGPFYGMIVGASTDIFGFMLFNTTGLAFTPFVTVGYVVLGFLPYFLYRLFQGPMFKRFGVQILLGLLTLISAYAIYFAYANDSFTFRNGPEVLVIELDQVAFRIVGPIVLITVFFGFVGFIQWLKNFTKSQVLKPMTVALMVFIVEILITIIWGGLWRSIYFGASQWVFFFTQTGFFVIGYPIKTLLVYFLYLSYSRYNLLNEREKFPA
jgi:ECF transporter S component (folate family)